MRARVIGLLLPACLIVVAAGCTTHADFKLPERTTIRFEQDKKLTAYPSGEVVRRPFFWNVTGGIKYELLDNGKVVGEGKLLSRFRVVSIFWPPFAIIYWPMGFREPSYDLTAPTPSR